MKNLIRPTILVGALAAMAALIFVSQTPHGQDGCSLATLSGNYIWSYDGMTLDGDARLPYAYAGMENYNADGTMSGMYSGTYNGEAARNVTYTGAYTVNADCSGTLATLDDGAAEEDALTYDIYINASTGNFYFTAIDEGEANQGFNRKVN
jgi:hypothetical protein